jgi:hypothetical protein
MFTSKRWRRIQLEMIRARTGVEDRSDSGKNRVSGSNLFSTKNKNKKKRKEVRLAEREKV